MRALSNLASRAKLLAKLSAALLISTALVPVAHAGSNTTTAVKPTGKPAVAAHAAAKPSSATTNKPANKPASKTSTVTAASTKPAVTGAVFAKATATKVTQPKPMSLISRFDRTFFASMPPGASAAYEVVADSGTNDKRIFAVQLERRVAEPELKRIAGEIRDSEAKSAITAIMMFYLPGMRVGHGVWAHVYYSPDPKVTIVGLTTAEEERLIGDVRRDNRSLIGAWLTASPAPVGKLTLYRERGRLFAEWALRDGARFTEEVLESTLPGGGWRYDRRDGGAGDHMLLTTAGTLELRDRDDVSTLTQAVIRNAVDLRVSEQRAEAKGNDFKPGDIKPGDGRSDARSAKLTPGSKSADSGAVTITNVGSGTTTSASAIISVPGAVFAPVAGSVAGPAKAAKMPPAAREADRSKDALKVND
jgi:hypothetical protein